MSDSQYFAAEARFEPEVERLSLLESLYDAGTVEMLAATGVGPGWQCLVPGAGHGSIARWLAHRVTPGGHVVATDIDTRFLDSSTAPGLEVRRHDLLQDPLERDRYDLVHARNLLVHLVGQQDQAVERMVAAVRPGGWLAIEECEADSLGSADPAHPAHQVVEESFAVTRDAGRDRVDWLGGRHVAALVMRHRELRVVNIDLSARIERGGSLHSRFHSETLGVVLAALGESEQSVRRFEDAMTDPSLTFVTEMRYRILAQRVERGTGADGRR